MHARERLIREHFAAHACPRCERPQDHAGMLVLARRHDTWLVLVACPACDHRGIYVAAFPPADRGHAARAWPGDAGALEVRPLSPAALAAGLFAATTPDAPTITRDDVQAMHAFLQAFDGDFQRVFADS
jgi:hypothetical protein